MLQLTPYISFVIGLTHTPDAVISNSCFFHSPPSSCLNQHVGSLKTRRLKGQEGCRPRPSLPSLPSGLSWPARVHIHTDFQQITVAMWSSLLLALLIILHQRKSKVIRLNGYRAVALTSVVMTTFGRIVLACYLKGITGPPTVCLLGKQVCGWCNKHRATLSCETPWWSRVLFVDFSFLFQMFHSPRRATASFANDSSHCYVSSLFERISTSFCWRRKIPHGRFRSEWNEPEMGRILQLEIIVVCSS